MQKYFIIVRGHIFIETEKVFLPVIFWVVDEESGKEIIQKAAKSVNSLKEDAFDITFNPDVFQPIVKHGNTDVSLILKRHNQAKIIKKSVFLLSLFNMAI